MGLIECVMYSEEDFWRHQQHLTMATTITESGEYEYTNPDLLMQRNEVGMTGGESHFRILFYAKL